MKMSTVTNTAQHSRSIVPPVPAKAPGQLTSDFVQYIQLMHARERDLRNTQLIRELQSRPDPQELPGKAEIAQSPDYTPSVLSRGVTAAAAKLRLRTSVDILEGISLAYDMEMAATEQTYTYAETCFRVKTEANNRHPIISACNSKGGAGKTPLQTHLAVLYAWITNRSTLFVEANENDGTAYLRLDMRRGGLVLLPAALKNHNLIAEHKIACNNLGKHFQTSLYALLSDDKESNNEYTLQEFLSMLEVLDAKFEATFMDPGNGFKKANEGSFLVADSVLFPVVADDETTFATMLSTKKNLYEMGHRVKLQQHSLTVINGSREGDTVEGFLQKIRAIAVEMTSLKKNPETQKEESSVWTTDPDVFLKDIGFSYDESGNLTGENIFMVPFSQWIADGKPVSILPEDTGLETLTAYAEILFACLTKGTQTDEEKQAEIDRRLRDRKELPQGAMQSKTAADRAKQLRAELVALSNGNPEMAAFELLSDFNAAPQAQQEKALVEHQ